MWQIALKASAGNGDDVYSVWTQDVSGDGGPGCSNDPTVKCSKTYKSSNVDYWEGVSQVIMVYHDDVIKWKRLFSLLALYTGIHRSNICIIQLGSVISRYSICCKT